MKNLLFNVLFLCTFLFSQYSQAMKGEEGEVPAASAADLKVQAVIGVKPFAISDNKV